METRIRTNERLLVEIKIRNLVKQIWRLFHFCLFSLITFALFSLFKFMFNFSVVYDFSDVQ